jgi:hypothetical protein
MARRRMGDGIELEHGNRLVVTELQATGIQERVVRRGEETAPLDTEPLTLALQSAFASLELRPVHVFELSAPAPGATEPAWQTRSTDDASLKVSVEGDDAAVVLLEQDGVLRWILPRYQDAAPAVDQGVTIDLSTEKASPAVTTAPLPVRREAVFDLRAGDPKTRNAARTGHVEAVRRSIRKEQEVRRGDGSVFVTAAQEVLQTPSVIDWALGKVRAYVLKFVGRQAIEAIVEYLESKLVEGFVALPGHPTIPAWQRGASVKEIIALPTDRPARILLFCHGTFSSTFGSFVGLEGSAFLTKAWKHYDAVIGYDHKSLSLDPKQNAEDLKTRLTKAWGDLSVPIIDAISYSRGGLVYRSLAETLAPDWSWGRVVYVASPNGGTHLAAPANWKRLIDLYTNLALATGKALSTVTPYALPVAELIGGIGAFVKYLATEVVSENAVPGLAAMNPDGAFVGVLNQAPGDGKPPTVFTIASNFEARDSNDPFLQKIGSVLLDEGLLDPLFGTENDLVVDTASSGHLTDGMIITDSKLYAPDESVYHLNYFVQEATHKLLTDWLLQSNNG